MFRPLLGAAVPVLSIAAIVGSLSLSINNPLHADPGGWDSARLPTLGPARVIGGYTAGCIAGAVPLAAEGPGYQVIRLSRHRYYGHPTLVDFVRGFGRGVEQKRLGVALIADLGQPRGGPIAIGHASHQSGLDVDIWFRLDLPRLPGPAREGVTEIQMADPRLVRLNAGSFGRGQAEMLRIAASDSRVSRIFVNPAIKRAICNMGWNSRSWLQKVRPWWGHTGHFHVRLNCPAGSPECEPQKPLPDGEGCDAELESWFPKHPPPPEPARKTVPVRRNVILPPSCTAVLQASG